MTIIVLLQTVDIKKKIAEQSKNISIEGENVGEQVAELSEKNQSKMYIMVFNAI